MRPANLSVELGADLDRDVRRIDGTVGGDAAELAAALWDLGAWSTAARELLDRLDSVAPADASMLTEGFVVSASVLRLLQADPLLPSDLLPNDWPGSALRESYDVWDRAYRGQLTAWYRAAG